MKRRKYCLEYQSFYWSWWIQKIAWNVLSPIERTAGTWAGFPGSSGWRCDCSLFDGDGRVFSHPVFLNICCVKCRLFNPLCCYSNSCLIHLPLPWWCFVGVADRGTLRMLERGRSLRRRWLVETGTCTQNTCDIITMTSIHWLCEEKCKTTLLGLVLQCGCANMYIFLYVSALDYYVCQMCNVWNVYLYMYITLQN